MHLSLNCRYLDRSVTWYEAFFGVSAHKRREGYANFDLENPPLKLAIQSGDVDGQGTLNHLGILVSSTAEVHAAKDRLEGAGLVTFSEENVTCCYARQDKIWVRDPDGNSWEVYALLDDMLDINIEEPGDESVACCLPNNGNSKCC